MGTVILAAIAALAAQPSAQPATPACAPSQARAQISSIEPPGSSSVQIRRAGARRPGAAHVYDYLCPADVVIALREGVLARVTIAGQDRPVVVTAAQGEYRIPDRRRLAPLAWVDTQVRRLRDFLAPTPEPYSPTPTQAGPVGAVQGQTRAGQAGAAQSRTRGQRYAARRSREARRYGWRSDADGRYYRRGGDYYRRGGDRLSVQYVPRGTRRIWLPDTGVSYSLAAVARSPESGRRARAMGPDQWRIDADTSPPAGAVAGALISRSIGSEYERDYYVVQAVGPREVPLPPELAGRTRLTPQERLGRALWLLGREDRGSGWQFFALAELHDLASDFVIADLKFRAFTGSPIAEPN